MSDTHPTQASGGDGEKGAADGVENAPGKTAGGGESGGGAYRAPDPATGDAGGFFGHGGQSEQSYSGPGDEEDGGGNPNATKE